MKPENVRLTEIDPATINQEALTHAQKDICIGALDENAQRIQAHINRIVKIAKEGATNFYLLSWQGSKVPHGVEVNGKRIGWTQHGVVSSETGETIGLYDRLIEFGGETGCDHQLLIYTANQNDN